MTKEKNKLARVLNGIREINKLPQALFIIDSKKEEIAVKEAAKLNIPIVGFIDTNCDPDHVDFPIPGNDDALKSIRLVTSLVAESIIEGRQKFLVSERASQKAQSDEAALEKAEVGIKEEIESIAETAESTPEEKRGPTKVKLSREKK